MIVSAVAHCSAFNISTIQVQFYNMTDFLLHEGPMGYSLFKVVHQPESIGNRLKEVQDAAQDLAKFGKMVQLQSFLPFEYGTSKPTGKMDD